MKNESELFARPNDEARIHDLEQYTLWQPTPGRPRYRSRMTFGERNGAARVTVFPNFEDGPKVLFCGIHPDHFYWFLSQVEVVARGPNDRRCKIDNYGKVDPAGKIEDATNRTVRNSLWFGKDAEGICWFGIEQKEVKNIRFTIEVGDWHALYITPQDGSTLRQMTAAEASVGRALGMVQGLRAAMNKFATRLRPPYEKPNKQQDSVKPRTETEPSTLSTFGSEDVPY